MGSKSKFKTKKMPPRPMKGVELKMALINSPSPGFPTHPVQQEALNTVTHGGVAALMKLDLLRKGFPKDQPPPHIFDLMAMNITCQADLANALAEATEKMQGGDGALQALATAAKAIQRNVNSFGVVLTAMFGPRPDAPASAPAGEAPGVTVGTTGEPTPMEAPASAESVAQPLDAATGSEPPAPTKE